MVRITQTPVDDTEDREGHHGPGTNGTLEEDPVLQARQDGTGDLEGMGTAEDGAVETAAAEDPTVQVPPDEDSLGDDVYVTRYFQGTLPAGTGDVAKTLAAQFTPEQQR